MKKSIPLSLDQSVEHRMLMKHRTNQRTATQGLIEVQCMIVSSLHLRNRITIQSSSGHVIDVRRCILCDISGVSTHAGKGIKTQARWVDRGSQ